MKKLAFASAVILTTFTFFASDRQISSDSGAQLEDFKTQTAVLDDHVNQLAPTVTGRGNLAQADGKAIY